MCNLEIVPKLKLAIVFVLAESIELDIAALVFSTSRSAVRNMISSLNRNENNNKQSNSSRRADTSINIRTRYNGEGKHAHGGNLHS